MTLRWKLCFFDTVRPLPDEASFGDSNLTPEQLRKATLRRKKVCPHCREQVKVAPAEVWLIKGLLDRVDDSMNRGEGHEDVITSPHEATRSIQERKGMDLPIGVDLWKGERYTDCMRLSSSIGLLRRVNLNDFFVPQMYFQRNQQSWSLSLTNRTESIDVHIVQMRLLMVAVLFRPGASPRQASLSRFSHLLTSAPYDMQRLRHLGVL